MTTTVHSIQNSFAKSTATEVAPRKIRPEDFLALVLTWTRTKGHLMSFQMMFGMSLSNLRLHVSFGKRVLVVMLLHDEYVRLKMPNRQKWRKTKDWFGNIPSAEKCLGVNERAQTLH